LANDLHAHKAERDGVADQRLSHDGQFADQCGIKSGGAWETKGGVSFARLDVCGPLTMPTEIAVAPRGKYPFALTNGDSVVA
jgi:hypothetical protein